MTAAPHSSGARHRANTARDRIVALENTLEELRQLRTQERQAHTLLVSRLRLLAHRWHQVGFNLTDGDDAEDACADALLDALADEPIPGGIEPHGVATGAPSTPDGATQAP